VLPFSAGVHLLRGLRAARGLAPVVDTAGGYVAEGAIVGGPLEFARRPEGSEGMTTGEALQARALQAGIGLAAGAVLDFGTARLSEFVRQYTGALRDERFAHALEEEAKTKGFASADEYVSALVEFRETPDGIVVTPRQEVTQALPKAPGEAAPSPAPRKGFTPIEQSDPVGAARADLPEFPSENARRAAEHDERAARFGLTPEQRDAFRPEEQRDHLTQFGTRADRDATVDRAAEWVNAQGRPGHYVALDLVNLGGLNAKLGEPGADKVFRDLAAIVREELEPLPGHVNLFRHGGDEMSAVVLGVPDAEITQTLQRISARADDYVQRNGLADIPHTKAGKESGAGVHYGVASFKPGGDVASVMKQAHYLSLIHI
jgi:GGDEF domain-containing protein